MKYVGNVIGPLTINDLHISINNMEIVDLSSEDFKSSFELREALRNAMIIPYNALVHKHAYEIKKYHQPQNVQSDTKETKEYIKGLESKFDLILNKINNILFTKEIIKEVHIVEAKSALNTSSISKAETVPIYVPKIDTTDVSMKQIITKEEQAEGTDNILEQLKKLKK